MARRRSFMATRMSKMRGLDRSEKELLVGIGEIVDNAVNNRTPTNPTGTIRKAGKNDPRLPPVTNLLANSGVRSVKLTWDPVDGTILENYAITFTNLNTGETTEGISYTSNFTFKGESGNYKAQIKPIGRNGVAAPIRTIFFTVQDSVMILEGAKNGVSTESPYVSEVVLTPADYKVFAWASFVLNSFASPVQNHSPVVQLRYGDELATSTLIQEITMFPESETATNLNDLDYGIIFRPDGASPLRSGNFETSHAVMFAPFDIPDAIANQSTRFWVNVTGREAEEDVISTSIVLWVGSGGRGELGVTPVATVNPRSIDQPGLENIHLAGIKDQAAGEFENEFTLSWWVKPFDLEGEDTVSTFFKLEPNNGIINHYPNKIEVVYRSDSVTLLRQSIEVFIYGSFGFISTDIISWVVSRPYVVGGSSDIWTNGNNNWNFLTLVWNSAEADADRLKVYMNGVLFVTGGVLTVTTDLGTHGLLVRDLTVPLLGFLSRNLYVVSQDNLFNISFYVRNRLNSGGVWDSALTVAEILTLYNGGAGANVDWRVNSGDYSSSATLSHYWLYGLDTTDNLTIAADYGNSPVPINMNLWYDPTLVPPSPIDYSPMTTSDVVTDAPV